MISKEIQWKIEYIEGGIEKSEEGKAEIDHILHISKKFDDATIKSIEGIIKKEYSSIDLTSLQVSDIGYKAFHYCKHFELKGIVNLFCII